MPEPERFPTRRTAGFTYLALLFAVAIGGVGLAAAATFWSTDIRRDKEEELLFIGEEFRRAIALYYYRTPGPVRQYPATLAELLEDSRYPGTQRYLRRLYRDPMTGAADWGLILTPDGRIQGVHSRSTDAPFKQAQFPKQWTDFEGKQRYADWTFVFVPVENVSTRTAK